MEVMVSTMGGKKGWSRDLVCDVANDWLSNIEASAVFLSGIYMKSDKKHNHFMQLNFGVCMDGPISGLKQTQGNHKCWKYALDGH